MGFLCPQLWAARRGYYAPAVYLLAATLITAIYAPLPRYGVSHAHLARVRGAGLQDLADARCACFVEKTKSIDGFTASGTNYRGGGYEHEALAALAQAMRPASAPTARTAPRWRRAYGENAAGDRCREKANLVVRQIDRWIASMERLRLADYVRYVDDRKRLFWTEAFSAACARGGHGGGLYHSGRHSW